MKFTKQREVNMLEIWKIKDVCFNSNGLLVSNFGNVKNESWGDRTITDNGNGYKKVMISELGSRSGKNFYIHRLVAELFLSKPECPSKIQVNHIDGDKSNNNLSNLEWVSPKDNIAHMHKNGLNLNRRNLKNTRKASDGDVFNAYLSVKIGALGVRESADKYGMPRTTLSSIVNKRSRRDVTDFIDEYFKL